MGQEENRLNTDFICKKEKVRKMLEKLRGEEKTELNKKLYKYLLTIMAFYDDQIRRRHKENDES